MPHLLIVEDHASIAKNLAEGLTHEGYKTSVLNRGDLVKKFVTERQPDLIILDLGLPGKDGIAVLNELRRAGATLPILCLTARDTRTDKLTGFNSGADDYLVKPFDFDELLARLRALLRRTQKTAEALICGELRIDPAMHTAHYKKHLIALAPREFEILTYLAQNNQRVVNRSELMEEIWGGGKSADQTLDVHLSNLRQKLTKAGARNLITTIKGVGYRLVLLCSIILNPTFYY